MCSNLRGFKNHDDPIFFLLLVEKKIFLSKIYLEEYLEDTFKDKLKMLKGHETRHRKARN